MRKILLTILFIATFSNPSNIKADSVNAILKADINYLRKVAIERETERRIMLIKAIIQIESNGRVAAYNPSEDAVGVLQVRPIMLREINRVVGYEKYKLSDRWDKMKSIAMFIDYQNYRNPNWDYELAARTWNGGHTGDTKYATISYWMKVKREIKKLEDGNNLQHINPCIYVLSVNVGR